MRAHNNINRIRPGGMRFMLPALFPSKLLRYGFTKKYPAQRFIP